MAIRYIDMFAGIGGFRSGLDAIGGFQCIGYCEIDRYAKQAYEAMYDTKGEFYYDDATTIKPEELPDIDLICGGFPCQAFSVSGKRGGFDDARGTLFFEIARIAAVKRPAFLFLENVPGLLSHDAGRTFATILGTLSELGYNVAWQVLNSKDYGVPQSRKRVYIIGYLRERCAGEVLSFRETNAASPIQIVPGTQGERIYATNGVAITLTSGGGGCGGKTGLYSIDVPIKANTKTGYQIAHTGDSIECAFPTSKIRRCRVGRQIAHTLTTANTQTVVTEENPTITSEQEHSKVLEKGPMYTVTATDKHGEVHYGRVRKLTPLESWRLQGFTDEQFYKAKATGLSDGRLYKMAGNAVSVPVISAVGRHIKDINERYQVVKGGE